jgi:hypothetical protein
VAFETHFRFAPDDIVVAPTTLRFMNQAEVAAFLANVGFTTLAWFGDWDRAPVTATSPELIVLAS